MRLTDPYAIEFGAQIQSSQPDQPIWVHGNPIQLEQALVNLTRNAIEANGRNIELIVTALLSEGTASIEVRDDGAGISDADKIRIFEPFYTTKRNGGGAGIGLSVAHGIVKEHGGTLEVATNSAGRTCVRIDLPVVTAPLKDDSDGGEPHD